MLCMLNMSLKREVGGQALNIHGNYIVDHGKSRYINIFILTMQSWLLNIASV